MIDIIFITGNRTKYAHLCYLAQNYSIQIKLFHELSYHATYTEPRVYDREKLLTQSVESAIAQIKKTSIGSKNTLFLIEDTSVIINALSSKDNEVPGLDIKYWMKENNFQDINKKLIKENDRTVIVRSDMVLFNKDKTIYEYFSGFSQGSIVKEEFDIKTHLFYPWLDNQTFNKWFIPKGEKVPISCLDIEQATSKDFRNDALLKLLDFLYPGNQPNFDEQKKAFQRELFSSANITIITGYTCAGKTTIAQYLSKKYGLLHLEASDYMHLSFYDKHGINTSYKIRDFAKIALKEDPGIVAKQIINTLVMNKNIVISGFRSPDEINYLTKCLPSDCLTHIQIEADFEVRYQRFLQRGRNKDNLNINTFKDINQRESEMGVNNFDAVILSNNKSFNKLYSSFEKVVSIKKGPGGKIVLSELKKDIMLFLKDEYSSKEQGKYFSTTDISKKIDHHKDNISRFFNQKYSYIFEINQESGTNKYRLSNTGYSLISLYVNQKEDKI